MINSLFSDKTTIDCAGAVQAIYWDALMRSDRVAFNKARKEWPLKIIGSAGTEHKRNIDFWVPGYSEWGFDENEILPGDLVYFPNYKNYGNHDFKNENTIFIGNNQYIGFGLQIRTYSRGEIENELKEAFRRVHDKAVNRNNDGITPAGNLPDPIWGGSLYGVYDKIRAGRK